ncbi:phytoene desaturase family protein [Roseibacillus persicicus]|uniref:phytoene desaturase family protein n=1 Tax=Roseibacillus persicicus TaxID=454148 RepID=UPI00280E26FB|nr:phytoene desaturase family protein [Roseibacillus persicicus]MDQ8191890.1 phytoene desaturase family protein [Roseibacillus persicicus]
MQASRVAVIGAGLGGMSAAISLRAEGYEVEVFEKNPQMGGKLNVLEQDGFTFDLGPSIFTLPAIFEDLFKRAGKKMEDYVQLDSVTPHWRNFFEDGLVLDLFEEKELMRGELDKLPGDPEQHWKELQGFLDYARKQYEVLDSGYLKEGLDGLWEFLRHYGLGKIGRDIDYRPTMSEAITQRISDPAMRSIFEYFIKYVGSSALAAPGYMNMMPIIQFDYGLWYVRGGMYKLAGGLTKLMEEMGIKVHLGADVTAITRDGKAVNGIALADGSAHPFDIVVSNMEVVPTYEKLLGEPQKFIRKLDKFKPACSGLVIHLGTDRVYPELAHHNFIFSQNQHKHFRTVFEKGQLPDDPTLYVVAPTRTDPSKAPAGCDNIKILPHIPPLNDDGSITHDDYLALRERVLDKMERVCTPDLRKHIVTEDLLTPVDIERMYRSNKGSIYGVVSDWKLNRGFKAPKTSTKYKNLYFCGGSINPGGGMPMVVLSGQKVADRIIAHHSKA